MQIKHLNKINTKHSYELGENSDYLIITFKKFGEYLILALKMFSILHR